MDLSRIKDAFHGLLCGIYHFRVRYPDQEEDSPPAPAPPEAEATVEEAGDDEFDGEAPTIEERSTLG